MQQLFSQQDCVRNLGVGGRIATLAAAAVVCVAIGQVAQHAYVMAAMAAFMLVLGLFWPWFILRFVSASSHTHLIRTRVPAGVELKLDVGSRWPLPLPGIEIGSSTSASCISIPVSPITVYPGRHAVPLGITARRRGVFCLSNLTIGTSFPFGLLHGRRAVRGAGRLVVWPSAAPVAATALRGASFTVAVDSAGSRVSTEGELAGVRGYRRGDAMRSIHWQQTARHDRLIVMERVGNERRACVVCLDTRRSSYDDEESFERAVSIVAGAIERGLREGLSVELRIAQARLPITDDRELANAMDALAEITWSDAIELPAGLCGLFVTTAKGWSSVARGGFQPYLVTGGHP